MMDEQSRKAMLREAGEVIIGWWGWSVVIAAGVLLIMVLRKV